MGALSTKLHQRMDGAQALACVTRDEEEELDLAGAHTQLSPAGCSALFSALASNTTLRRLWLARGEAGQAGPASGAGCPTSARLKGSSVELLWGPPPPHLKVVCS